MKVLFILGDVSVGKMTVGQEISKRTGMVLLHNHLAIEPVVAAFGEIRWHVVNNIREAMYMEAAATARLQGVIITMAMNYNKPRNWSYLNRVMSYFYDATFYGLELSASVETRIARAQTENRLRYKPSQRDTTTVIHRISDSANDLTRSYTIDDAAALPFTRTLQLTTDLLTASDVADKAVSYFRFRRV